MRFFESHIPLPLLLVIHGFFSYVLNLQKPNNMFLNVQPLWGRRSRKRCWFIKRLFRIFKPCGTKLETPNTSNNILKYTFFKKQLKAGPNIKFSVLAVVFCKMIFPTCSRTQLAHHSENVCSPLLKKTNNKKTPSQHTMYCTTIFY